MSWLIAKTFGIEIEFSTLSTYKFTRNTTNNFRVTHDASVENRGIILDGILVDNQTNLKLENSRTGGELVSRNPLTLKNLNPIKSALEFLIKNGEDYNPRTSIHIHVTMPYNLNILKTILFYGLVYEKLFYAIGAMGGEHRGETNKYNYCRSLNNPPVVKCPGGYCKMYDINDLFNAKSIKDFWVKYGNVYYFNGRYQPIRYLWLNLFSLFVRSSLEFRIFNYTTSFSELEAIIELCVKFSQFILIQSFSKLPEKDFITLDSNISKSVLFHQLNELSNLINLSGKSKNMLEYLIDKAKMPISNGKSVFTHLMFYYDGDRTGVFFENGYCPPKVNKNEVEKPVFVDIHQQTSRPSVSEGVIN